MSTTTVNGSRRPSLAEQIERLDAILDGLAEGLNEAVTEAVRRALSGAVQSALREALASPELRQRLAPPPLPETPAPESAPAPEPAPTAGQRCHASMARAWGWTRGLASRADRGGRDLLLGACAAMSDWAGSSWRGTRSLAARGWQARRKVGLSAGAGVAAGLMGYLAGPVAAALGCGLSVAAFTAAGLWLVPLLRLALQAPTES
jgi:hypothetical protein